MKKLMLVLIAAMVVSFASAADVAGWEAFVIRNASTGGTAPTITDLSTGYKEFDVELGGQKAGWGTNLANGMTIGDIQSFSIDRESSLDSSVYGPYINIWITNGTGEFAILANEPSDAEWVTGGVRNAWDITWSMLEGKRAKIYEDSNGSGNGDAASTAPSWIADLDLVANGGNGDGLLTFGELASLEISAPSSAPSYSATGAPDDLNAATYTAYGFNWIFGDSQSNYVGQYPVANPSLVVPEPATLALLGLGGLLLRKRK